MAPASKSPKELVKILIPGPLLSLAQCKTPPDDSFAHQWEPSLSSEDRAQSICLVDIQWKMLSGTYCLIYQDTKIHLRSGAILSIHITSYTSVSFVNTECAWVPLNRKESRRNKWSLKDKARQLSKSCQETHDRDTHSHPNDHLLIIKVTKEGRQAAPAA